MEPLGSGARSKLRNDHDTKNLENNEREGIGERDIVYRPMRATLRLARVPYKPRSSLPWFFVLMTGGNESGNQMDHKIDRTAMARMLDLRDILELVDDGRDTRAFAYQELVGKIHEMILHVFAQLGDEMESLFKEQRGQGSKEGAAIP